MVLAFSFLASEVNSGFSAVDEAVCCVVGSLCDLDSVVCVEVHPEMYLDSVVCVEVHPDSVRMLLSFCRLVRMVVANNDIQVLPDVQ